VLSHERVSLSSLLIGPLEADKERVLFAKTFITQPGARVLLEALARNPTLPPDLFRVPLPPKNLLVVEKQIQQAGFAAALQAGHAEREATHAAREEEAEQN
jgi:hypothetical protein